MKLPNVFNLKRLTFMPEEDTKFERYLSKQIARFDDYIQAAKDYPKKIGIVSYMFFKPFDDQPGNASYYYHMFDILSLLQAMQIPYQGRILEVGSGPGWITEILISLGFEVDAIEPSEDFIEVAQQRLQKHIEHHHIAHPPRVIFHNTTLEECDLPDESFDAILFYAALHHIIDEDKGIAQCLRLLRPGGKVGISESAWIPGDKQLESAIEEEMAKYHTLENPFTATYLDQILVKHGFSEVNRFYQVNGLFDASMGDAPLRSVATCRPETHNIVIARKQSSQHPTTAQALVKAHAQITILNADFNFSTRQLSVRLKLVNDGEVTWLHEQYSRGWVNVACYRGNLAGADFVEAGSRTRLPSTIMPKEEITLNCVFPLPELDDLSGTWNIDLVNEGFYFFGISGTEPATFVLPQYP
jgi:SAM-dependent methyltransferase